MYREGELVEVKEYTMKTKTTQAGSEWEEYWTPGVIIQWHGETRMRTGIARFEVLEVASVLVNGKVRKVPTRNLRHPRG